MLDQEADHTFVRGERRAVNAERHFIVTFFICELQVKTLRHGKIHLICGKREFLADGAPNLHIDLGSVERGFILRFHKGDVAIRHGAPHHIFRLQPQALIVHVLLAQTLFGMQTKTHDILVDVKDLKIFVVQVDHAHEFLLELFLRAVNVRVIHLH